MNLTPEQREIGKENYYEAVGSSRRDFLKGVIASGAVAGGAGLGATYFKYSKVGDPLRIGVIGTGDEGQVLIGAINPDYVQVKAIADIRPYNVHRAFHGDWGSPAQLANRPGLIAKYQWQSEDEARKNVKVYDQDYHDLLKDKDIEAVIIALPLHLHAKVTIEALQAGKHVLCEKLMAHNIAQCKMMGRFAAEKNMYLAIGHQRHYSMLYDNAVNLMQWGLLGQLHHIRAQWHRGNLPGKDSWQPPLPGGEVNKRDGVREDTIATDLERFEKALAKENDPTKVRELEHKVAQWRIWDADKNVKAEDYGYQHITLQSGTRSAYEELARWRLWERTGGGLMAELGSHQLDAASIFCSALRKDGKKAHPLTVHAVGGRHIFPLDRDAEDHVYCMFEFPGPDYEPDFPVGYKDEVMGEPDPKGIPGFDRDPNKKIVVTYSSINGNGFGGYGEVVMGTRGTLILEREQEVLLFKDAETSSKISVKNDKGGPTLDTQASGGPAAAVAKTASSGPVSKGYTEEIEHWAYCIREKAPRESLLCRPEVALGDAVIALTTNVAIKKNILGEAGYVKFKDEWYDLASDETPDGSSLEKEYQKLVNG